MQTCTKCKESQPLENFHKTSRTKNGRYHSCKNCEREYREANRDRIKKYREANKEYRKEYMKKWRAENRKYLLAFNKQRHARDKENGISYYQNNKEKHQQSVKLRSKERLLTDPLFKFKKTMRDRLYVGLNKRGLPKKRRTIEYLGMDYDAAKNYLASMFLPGMTWENHGIGEGKWNIDHIVPLSQATTDEEVIALFHYTNLQPLWWKDNLRKHKKVPSWYRKAV